MRYEEDCHKGFWVAVNKLIFTDTSFCIKYQVLAFFSFKWRCVNCSNFIINFLQIFSSAVIDNCIEQKQNNHNKTFLNVCVKIIFGLQELKIH